MGLLKSLLFAFFGGFILNLMPCVFPVLSIKVMGFVKQAKEGKGHAMLHSGLFTLGVLISFWVLAGIMLALKAAGKSADWGYQLQNPYIVMTVILVLFAMALNLFGVFEIGIGMTSVGQNAQKKTGLTGSFMSGILATIVATPCMAPMLGAAIAFALAQSAAIAMLIFTVIALGMSSPYIIFSMSPKLLKLMPKPGAWMETFKQSMGFLMMLAVVWLFESLQVLIAEGDMLFPIFWAFTFFAVALWVYGKYTPLYLAKSTRIKGLIASLLIATASLYYGYSKIDEKSSILWEVVEAQNLQKTLDQAIAQGQPVFVDFTAKWCATCQVNKSIAIAPNAALIDKKGVLMVKVDNTKKSPAVSPWLKKFESPGVPLNLLYDGKEDSLPIKFPESYTSGLMQEQLHKLPDSSK